LASGRQARETPENHLSYVFKNLLGFISNEQIQIISYLLLNASQEKKEPDPLKSVPLLLTAPRA